MTMHLARGHAAANTRPRTKAWYVWPLVGGLLAVLLGANAHLVYVAVTSQPDCVAPTGGPVADDAPLKAAKKVC